MNIHHKFRGGCTGEKGGVGGMMTHATPPKSPHKHEALCTKGCVSTCKCTLVSVLLGYWAPRGNFNHPKQISDSYIQHPLIINDV